MLLNNEKFKRELKAKDESYTKTIDEQTDKLNQLKFENSKLHLNLEDKN